jgi:hypothetical protein
MPTIPSLQKVYRRLNSLVPHAIRRRMRFVSLGLFVTFALGCSNKSAAWQDYLVALQVHDFELRALRQAEQIPKGPKQDEAIEKCKQRYERSLAHLRECSERLGTAPKPAAAK